MVVFHLVEEASVEAEAEDVFNHSVSLSLHLLHLDDIILLTIGSD